MNKYDWCDKRDKMDLRIIDTGAFSDELAERCRTVREKLKKEYPAIDLSLLSEIDELMYSSTISDIANEQIQAGDNIYVLSPQFDEIYIEEDKIVQIEFDEDHSTKWGDPDRVHYYAEHENEVYPNWNCFKTKEEAEQRRSELLKELGKSRYFVVSDFYDRLPPVADLDEYLNEHYPNIFSSVTSPYDIFKATLTYFYDDLERSASYQEGFYPVPFPYLTTVEKVGEECSDELTNIDFNPKSMISVKSYDTLEEAKQRANELKKTKHKDSYERE